MILNGTDGRQNTLQLLKGSFSRFSYLYVCLTHICVLSFIRAEQFYFIDYCLAK